MVKTKVETILYHANWCHFCKLFKPEWDKFEHSIPQINGLLKDVEISAKSIEESQLDKEKMPKINGTEIKGFPTIKIKVNEKEYEYGGKRNSESLKEEIMKLTKK